MTATATQSAKPPHLFWTLAEGRAVVELGAFYAFRGALSMLPRGDGHSVLVLPGFLASDRSTKPMRNLLTSLGYDAHGWDMGRNIRIDNARETQMNDLLHGIHEQSGRKVSIIGWSLGGVFAREIAKNAPDKVRQVISLGSPISNDRGHTNARKLFDRLNGPEPEPLQQGRFRNLDEAPPVPTTSILTKTDGIVAWRGSVQKPGPQTDNIEVIASHCGLGVNPMVMYAIADRLALPEDDWKPFERSGWRSLLFKTVTTD
ncbi:MAG: alpha/beta hydrolase [Blastomonas sp.]|uniref:esterase/lipase family protein n=1 Tax=Blastomonas sp. TaxID=1909299 RepID=UPI0025877891|nr:alpha/beta hydrolase [Blastomonas sp.]MCO5793166.1 alpha/beta hydrolase [Blastomonas sp.]